MPQMDVRNEFACPADDCGFAVQSSELEEVVASAKHHAEADHGEHLRRKTVLWQMRTGDRS